ncbi:hypothetical protein ACFPPD_23290 [Cohnella suwonensis]|uniref:DUF3953 domain-containing protein n=1 Tax=Cohnella suwonensis TaxID=696072 RepID=A0ABW0M0H3_9BACL
MKLRIPVFIFVVGVLSGIVQLINNQYTISKNGSYIESLLFFLIIGVTVFICERAGINDRKVNLVFGISFIAAGLIIDLITK